MHHKGALQCVCTSCSIKLALLAPFRFAQRLIAYMSVLHCAVKQSYFGTCKSKTNARNVISKLNNEFRWIFLNVANFFLTLTASGSGKMRAYFTFLLPPPFFWSDSLLLGEKLPEALNPHLRQVLPAVRRDAEGKRSLTRHTSALHPSDRVLKSTA